MKKTLLLNIYALLTRTLSPVFPLWLNHRAKQGKEDPTRQGERFGHTSCQRPAGKLIWMHGASVGETTMLLPLIDKLLSEFPDVHVMVTSGTLTSAVLLAQRLPDQAFHQYVPLDTPRAVAKFLDHWQPDLALWAESDIWPNLILATHQRDIPMALINARMSEKSIMGWARRPKTAKKLLGCFDKILAANVETSDGLSHLLGRKIENGGNLKDAAPPLPVNEVELKRLRKQIGNRPVWCAASTHRGEDGIILAAHEAVRKIHPEALLILALRHPGRRDEVMPLMQKFATRSNNENVTKSTQTYLFDTIGEMGLAFSLSDITLVCGSLIKGLMGHNPIEPAHFNNAILTGPHVSSFADSYAPMIAFDAAHTMYNGKEISETVSAYFSNLDQLQAAQNTARAFAQGRDAILADVWADLTPLFRKAKL